METHANIKSNSDVDGGGDCQTAAAAIVTDTTAPRHVIDDAVVEKICVKSSGKELTTTTTTATAVIVQKEQQQKLQQQKVTTAANNNNNNKLNKQQQQQQQQQQVQQQQQQPHQFRAPQQFVKHKKCTPNSALSNNNNNNTNGNVNKKGKTWNKRQHKNSAKQQQQHQRDNNKVQVNTNTNANTNISNSIGSNNVGNVCNLSSGQASGVLSSTKADLENSQNLKNQISTAGAVGGCGTANGGGNGVGVANNHQHTHHYQHYSHHNNNHHHHQQQQQQQQLGLGPVGNGVPPSVGLTNSEKLGYGHGHMKQQQTHKKILTHRGHHHHVLCAAHNNNVNVNGITNCCLATNQNGKEAKDTGLNNSIGKCVTSVRHFCCARAKFFLPEKRPRKEIIIPPTKFLLGGNISDPLNLNSLQNETSASNTPATTPRRSPITTPPKVEVIIPPNIHDPLHLLDPVDSMEYEKQLTSPMKRGGLRRGLGLLHSMPHFNKHRHRKNRKPKRRRHESHNSSISSTVMGSGLATSDEISSLSNNKLTTAPATVVEAADSQQSNNSSAIDYSEERKENITTTCSIVAHLEHNESNKETNSPTSGVVGEAMAVSTCGVGSHIEQQHVAGDMLLQQERLNRSDLRLDLHSTSSSTCGSTFSGSRISNGGGGGGGRKRRISESNASQKNKKFYRMDSMDKIVSPVVPQPGAWKRMPILATGARKPAKRTTSTSEIELLSPVDESMKSISIEESLRIETTDVIKLESMPESGLGSPLSTISGATSVAAGEQDSTVGENEINEEVTPVKEVNASKAVIANENKLPKFRLDGKKYRYGNYDRYAGFRHLNGFMDVRLQVFQRYVELFQGKDILDIGCNVGQMTISVAQNLAPQSILGIDIDFGLIAQARRNLSLYVRIPSKIQTQAVKQEKLNKVETKIKKKRRKNRKGKLNQQQPQQQQQHHNSYHHHHHQQQQQQQQHSLFCCNNGGNIKDLKVSANEFFPRSFALNYGGIPHATETVTTATATKTNSNNNNNKTSTTTTATTTITNTTNNFPRNVFFQQSNYVLKDESLLVNDTQQYDLILCLSVTKWIHLNFGDAGLKLAFKRIFNQLRPGGKLILEAQNWASYKKKKNLTEEIYNNYRNIEFFPNKFHEYLLSSEVGFSHSYTLGVPRHMNKGFCRPIQLYAKGDYTPNHVRWSDAHYPQTPYEAYRGIYADMPPRPPALCYPTSMASSRSHAYDTPHYTGASSGPYSCRQTPMHQPTSQYYNPLETDSYQPSYDMEYLNHMYVFASPLYQTVWSPPASLRKSSSHTPLFGSVREAELDGECSGGGSGGYYPRHVYPPNEDTSSPNANMGGAFNSIHEVDTDDSNHPPGGGVRHVYATTHCGESSSSPQVNHHENELNEAAIISDEDAVGGSSAAYCDFTEQ